MAGRMLLFLGILLLLKVNGQEETERPIDVVLEDAEPDTTILFPWFSGTSESSAVCLCENVDYANFLVSQRPLESLFSSFSLVTLRLCPSRPSCL